MNNTRAIPPNLTKRKAPPKRRCRICGKWCTLTRDWPRGTLFMCAGPMGCIREYRQHLARIIADRAADLEVAHLPYRHRRLFRRPPTAAQVYAIEDQLYAISSMKLNQIDAIALIIPSRED